jgi:hypothetical protein
LGLVGLRSGRGRTASPFSSNSFSILPAIFAALDICFTPLATVRGLPAKVFHRQTNVKLIFEYLKTGKGIVRSNHLYSRDFLETGHPPFQSADIRERIPQKMPPILRGPGQRDDPSRRGYALFPRPVPPKPESSTGGGNALVVL